MQAREGPFLPGESYEKQGHKQNDLSKPEACVVWDVSGQLPSGPLKPGVSHLLPWLACPSPLTPFYMTGQAAPSCTLAVLCPLQALNTPTSEYSQDSYISQSCPSSQIPLCTQLFSYVPEHLKAPTTLYLSRTGCCISPCNPALCPVSPGQKDEGHL